MLPGHYFWHLDDLSMKYINRLTNAAGDALNFAASLAVFSVLLIVSINVISRSFFSVSITSAHEIVVFYCMIPIAFLPLLKLELEDGHIVTDLFFGSFPQAVRSLLWTLRCLFTVAIFGMLAWFTLKQAIRATERSEIAMGISQMPIWQARWILPIAFSLAVIGALLAVAQHIKRGD